MEKSLQKKVDFALKVIESGAKIARENGSEIELSYSGGKDSDVILELAKLAGIEFVPIYKNTTIDPPGTIQHVLNRGVQMVRPKRTFFQLCEKSGLPTRMMRFCCRELKEYKIKDYAIVGIRRDESWKRAKMYQEPELCRKYRKGKVKQFLPILEWTNNDVEAFLQSRGVKCAPVYYDSDGKFHVERRLGCLCCPLASRRKRVEQFKQYPKMLRQYVKAGKKYWETHKPLMGGVYNVLTFQLFFDNFRSYQERFGCDCFRETFDSKSFLEDYFGVELP